MRILKLSLPWPPSVNHYWRVWKGRHLISKKGRQYREAVYDACLPLLTPAFGDDDRLSVTVIAYPPDNRRRDLDNILKSLLDALEHVGVYRDDSQIDDLRIVRDMVMDSGMVVVEIQPRGMDGTQAP